MPYLSLHSLADEDLVGLAIQGDARAFELIFDRHGGPAFSLAFWMCGRRTMAEDVVQDAFLSIWRSGAAYDGARGSVRSWVLGLVHNRAVDAFRHRAAKEGPDVAEPGDDEGIASTEGAGVEAAGREEGRELRGALARLPVEQRRVIELAYFGGFTHNQIAEMLDLPAGTVKGRMRLGLAKLRQALGEPAGTVL